MGSLRVAPYGSWKSPITADLIASGTIGLGQIALDGNDTYWIEMRPAEGGRSVIVGRTANGRTCDVTPAPFNVRTRVHEYGGGAFCVAGRTVYFSNFADSRLYRQDAGRAPQPLTHEGPFRYADAVIDRPRERLLCVCEDHSAAGHEPVNTLVSIATDGEASQTVLAAGSDFYASPRLSPDGSRLAWLTWDHPNMPWDGTELWIADIEDDGSLGRGERVAGGAEESIFQPEWSPGGLLYFVGDCSGWWNLYRWRDGRVEPLCPMAAEFGLPQWNFAMSTYGFVSAEQIVCTYAERGRRRLATLDTQTLTLTPVDTDLTDFDGVRTAVGRAVCIAGSPTQAPAIVQLDLRTPGLEVLRRSSEVSIDSGCVSIPEALEFPTEHGVTAYAFFYPPRNRDYTAPSGDRPPLLVMSHGGPTAATASTLRLAIQFWTSRGIAVLDVNYGGSTGYGRAYRQRLDGQWGVVDVDDCVNGARYLVERGAVDGHRLIIRGGSAGGYTTLCALTFRDVFKAGASYYGIGDLEALATDTHKFESRYEERLVGPYPERRDLYRARSPIHVTDQLSCPVIFFQGLDDKVVPPNQAEAMVAALRAKKLPVAYVPFEGEQHGFRRAETIRRALEAEIYFYARVFGFALAELIEPVPIDNLVSQFGPSARSRA
jgi:dipeptidyl aminopeptidase/acylaminoacyl peptidase